MALPHPSLRATADPFAMTDDVIAPLRTATATFLDPDVVVTPAVPWNPDTDEGKPAEHGVMFQAPAYAVAVSMNEQVPGGGWSARLVHYVSLAQTPMLARVRRGVRLKIEGSTNPSIDGRSFTVVGPLDSTLARSNWYQITRED
ncbi:hypothetical protein [Agromyces sp. NPDC058104]|uniref:hypothetical protein n=1 Tax=Agromyces sp. NPDC058104 TaxID=3346342 RepID=UPI0036DA4276